MCVSRELCAIEVNAEKLITAIKRIDLNRKRELTKNDLFFVEEFSHLNWSGFFLLLLLHHHLLPHSIAFYLIASTPFVYKRLMSAGVSI